MRGSALLSLPVRVDGILLGHVVDLILDRRLTRVLGLEVRCGDGEHRFLPLAVTRLRTGEIAVSTPLALLDQPQLAFYATHGARFGTLRATPSHGLDARVAELDLGDAGVVADVQLEGAA